MQGDSRKQKTDYTGFVSLGIHRKFACLDEPSHDLGLLLVGEGRNHVEMRVVGHLDHTIGHAVFHGIDLFGCEVERKVCRKFEVTAVEGSIFLVLCGLDSFVLRVAGEGFLG